jgi:hypothetical protein
MVSDAEYSFMICAARDFSRSARIVFCFSLHGHFMKTNFFVQTFYKTTNETTETYNLCVFWAKRKSQSEKLISAADKGLSHLNS